MINITVISLIDVMIIIIGGLGATRNLISRSSRDLRSHGTTWRKHNRNVWQVKVTILKYIWFCDFYKIFVTPCHTVQLFIFIIAVFEIIGKIRFCEVVIWFFALKKWITDLPEFLIFLYQIFFVNLKIQYLKSIYWNF